MAAKIPAAEYLRMSTEHQQYSMQNQAAVIRQYAAAHSFEIVQTYADAGKSGLVLKRRSGLQSLLADVVGGRSRCKAILVYDVSRWGRFQDADESAHYEFLCRSAGIHVHYCAEPFSNDGTLSSAILKAVKRTMAGEFSRELGVKVFEGKKRLAQLGFRVGGTAGFGLRRMLLSANGSPRHSLEIGQHKSLATDRTILIPGPRSEVAIVQKIFKMALQVGPTAIVRFLNETGIKSDNGNPWRYAKVKGLLSNPKYAGCNVWGRTAQKLRGPRIHLSPESWTSRSDSFKAIVSRDLFDRVQAALIRRHPRECVYSDTDLLEHLKQLLAADGKLTQRNVLSANGPSTSTYRHHFGSMKRAYEMIGYSLSTDTSMRMLLRQTHRQLREQLQRRIVEMCPKHLSSCLLSREKRHAILVDSEFHVVLIVCRAYQTVTRQMRWQLIPPAQNRDCIALLCLTNPDYDGFSRYYMLARIDKPKTYQIKSENDPWIHAGQPLFKLSDFYATAIQIRTGTSTKQDR